LKKKKLVGNKDITFLLQTAISNKGKNCT